MNDENLIAADQNDTGAASPEETQVEESSKSAADSLYPNESVSDEGAGEQEQQTEEAPPAGAPEKYEFKFAEGQVVDPEVLGEFEGIAKEANLTNEQAQKFAELGSKLSGKIAMQQAQKQAEQVEQWRAESLADKEFGGDKLDANLAVAKTALDTFASPQLVELLNASGLGNHPEVIRAFFKVGKAISPDSGLVRGNAPAPQKSAKDVLYGSLSR